MTHINRLKTSLNKAITNCKFESEPQNLYDPINYILQLGGKRIRPLLTLLSYDLYKDNYDGIIDTALAVEVFHNFTLMHDDIMDHAPLRRGKATVHEKWDTNSAILSGDVMLIKAYDLILKSDKKYHSKLLARFNQIAIQVCEGQQMDMNFESRATISRSEYIEMIRLKTAVLIGFSLELGGILADASKEDQKALYNLGENLGIAFQIQDDLLDTFGNPKTFGKKVGGDIAENKKTILWVEAMQSGNKKMIQALKSAYELANESEKIKKVSEIYEQIEAKVTCQELMEIHRVKCLQNIKSIKGVLFGKSKLRQLVDSLFVREQ